MKRSLVFITIGLLLASFESLGEEADLFFDEPKHVPRLALVIGNENYNLSNNHIRNAINSSEDAKLIAQALSVENLGFDTVVALNLSYEDIGMYVDELVDKRIPEATFGNVRPVVFFYFAGHGFSQEDDQRLVGIGAENDITDLYLNSFSLKSIEERLNNIARTFFFVDACRTTVNEVSAKNNDNSRNLEVYTPYSQSSSFSDNLGKGYAFYSTKRGGIARGKSKISSGYSPFAFILNNQLDAIDAYSTLNDVVDNVKSRVTDAIREQRPVLESESSGKLYLKNEAYEVAFQKQRLRNTLNNKNIFALQEYILNNPGGAYNYLVYDLLDDLIETR